MAEQEQGARVTVAQVSAEVAELREQLGALREQVDQHAEVLHRQVASLRARRERVARAARAAEEG